MRASSPLSIMPRRIWSSQTLVPAAVSAASRSFDLRGDVLIGLSSSVAL